MKKIIYIISLLIFSVSCSDYLDVNTDPNAILPTDISSEDMLRGSQLGNQFWHSSSAPRIMMIWMNQGTGSDRQYIAFNDWNNVTASSFDTSWGNAYRNAMFHADVTYNKALDELKPNLAAIAQITKAHSLGSAISLWGDIPYSQAFNNAEFPNPVFDSQLDLYAEVQSMLSNSISLLEANTDDSINNDLYYNGSKTKWVKLAHALKARYFLHLKEYQKAYNESQLAFANTSEDFNAIYLADDGANNPYFTFQENRTDYLTGIDSYGYNLLKSGTDNYRGHSKTNEIRRKFYIYTSQQKLNFGGIGKFGKLSNIPLVTYGEMLLIKAEYQARTNGLTNGVAALNDYRELLKQGYTIGNDNDCFGNPANCDGYYDLFIDDDFSAGDIENVDGINPVDALLREIYEERYVFFTGNFEAFTDYRRTNNIAEIELKTGNEGTPQRFIYAQSEINGNSNVPSPVPSVSEKTAAHN